MRWIHGTSASNSEIQGQARAVRIYAYTWAFLMPLIHKSFAAPIKIAATRLKTRSTKATQVQAVRM